MSQESILRVIVAGSRSFSDYELLKGKMDALLSEKIKSGAQITIVCGMARGADLLGKKYGEEKGFAVQEFPADWEKYGKKAGILRNEQMAQNADALVAFWDGISRGTKNMIDLAKQYKLAVRVIKYPAEG